MGLSARRRILFCPDKLRTNKSKISTTDTGVSARWFATDESKLSTTDTSLNVRWVGRAPVGHKDRPRRFAENVAAFPTFLRTDAGMIAYHRILFRRSSKELKSLQSSPTGKGLS
ncbi:hypothetical protein Bbelb_221380 [Branchiostoma belcheri]|nr:hypothetical protein Bbelb_221380 [Branchiostoma belcheri]